MTKKNTKKKEEENFVVMSTKIAPWAAEVWNEVCEALRTDTYHLLQQFIMAMISIAGKAHNPTATMKKLIDVLGIDAGWQKAINIAAPSGTLSIAQMILILEQGYDKGFTAVMIDKPWMGECQQTENGDRIFERLTEVIFKPTYKRLRQLAAVKGFKSQRQLLEHLLADQIEEELKNELRCELPGLGVHTEQGKEYGFGKKTKGKQHLTPDSVSHDLRFKFDEAEDEAMKADYHIDEREGNFANHEDEEDPWTAIENGNINFEEENEI